MTTRFYKVYINTSSGRALKNYLENRSDCIKTGYCNRSKVAMFEIPSNCKIRVTSSGNVYVDGKPIYTRYY